MKKEFVTKLDLGMVYFPDIDARYARQKLCEYIHSDDTLYQRLVDTGYRKSAKCFTPCQLSIIFERLGMPWGGKNL